MYVTSFWCEVHQEWEEEEDYELDYPTEQTIHEHYQDHPIYLP